MDPCKIKNVVFDIGNVIVRWSPVEIVRLTFGAVDQPEQLAQSVFQSDIWLDLNRGAMPESEAKTRFQEQFDFTAENTEQLFYYVKHTQCLLFGSVELLKQIKTAGYGVYALTDNVVEIVEHLQSRYDFWTLFDGAIVSAEVGCLKPQAEIFNQLLTQYGIEASESVFLDDMPHNVKGAQSVGFATVQFENATQCAQQLKSLGLRF